MKKRNLTEGSIAKNLLFLAAPIVLGMMLHSAFNIIDTIFIGMLGANELAAVAITFPVVFVFIAMASGLSIGATVLISQSIGANDLKNASNAAEHSLLLALVIGVLIAVLGILFSEPIFVFMGADANILPLTIQYSQLIFIGFIFLFIGFIAQGILQAEGDSKTPFKFNLIAVILNVVLDAILIFGLIGFPAMGIVGAALATVISRSIGAFLMIAFLLRGKAQTKACFNLKYFKFDLGIVKKLFALGIPASIGNITSSIGMILLMSFIGVFGSHAIAAYGIGLRIDSIARMPIIGLMSAVVAITGQNIGAKNFERINKTVKIALGLVLITMIPATIIMISFPELLFGIFSSDANVLSAGAEYLSIVAFSYVFFGIAFISMGALQGAGKTILSALLIALNWILVLLFAFYLKDSMGLIGIWYSILAATILFTGVSGIIYLSKIWLRNK
ncbi:MAG: MATE family efflux transporter [Candidatus Diapherotrites archaeon]